MYNHELSKDFIERAFLEYYANGRSGEFFLADNYHDLTGFPRKMLEENCKKLKDVAVSLVRAGLIKGAITRNGNKISVNIHGITTEGRAYLHSR